MAVTGLAAFGTVINLEPSLLVYLAVPLADGDVVVGEAPFEAVAAAESAAIDSAVGGGWFCRLPFMVADREARVLVNESHCS